MENPAHICVEINSQARAKALVYGGISGKYVRTNFEVAMSDRIPPALTGSLLESMPDAVADRDRIAAALHLLDWLGCAIAGTRTEVGRAMAVAAGAIGGPLDPSGRRGPDLAWALGSFGSLLEMDDVHRSAILHPGPVVMPAVLACCNADNAHRAPEAALRGYQAMIRLGQSVGPSHYAHFHNTSTCGGLGAAVAAAFMLGLDRRPTQWAMAHALSMAGGLWECRNEPGATKHLHVAEAARRGVQAALAAAAGLAGPLHILEGKQGFYAGLAPDGNPDALLGGGPWALHETSFKPWPACRHAHPAIDAALALRKGLADRLPEAVTVATYADAVLFCDKPQPIDPAGARFSLQHAVAVALIDGPPEMNAFEPAGLARTDLAALRGRIKVVENSDLTAQYPTHFGARVTLHVGTDRYEAAVADAWGDSENPMDAAAVITKFDKLCAWAGLPVATASALKAAALDTVSGHGAADLLSLLAALPSPSDMTPKDPA